MLKLIAEMSHVDWREEYRYDNVCAKKPFKTDALDEPQRLELYPYGSAKLRMTEMPKIKK